MIRSVAMSLAAAAIVATPAVAQDAKESAERFSLDLPPAEDAAPAAEPADAPAPDAPAKPRFSADTPIEALIANRRSKAVLDREMPGLSGDKNLAKFSKLSLRQLAPLSGGRVTPDLLARVDNDLAGIK